MILFDKKVRQIKTVPIVSLFYPPVCGICGKLSSSFLCDKCRLLLRKEAKMQKVEMFNSKFYFEELLYMFFYQGIIRKVILDYKFNDKSYLFRTIVNFLLKSDFLFEILQSYDTIIPVPISKKRYRERGYNQSALIAKAMVSGIEKEIEERMGSNKSKQVLQDQSFGLSYREDCLFKVKNITEQSKLNKQQRQENIKDVYCCNQARCKELQDKRILLVDDIYTTGSTVNECCRMLQEAKPKKLGVFVLAKD